ncbi:MAG: monooxygenase FAD-binding protein [Nevskia sp.]|nr:monooxygenase FAD-binding protein [Nevskia sp.]
METVDCAIAGCGPAGAMLGLLLARAGLRVNVYEKHADFLRDFRGDTVHPSTLQVLDELGLAADFAQLPFRRVDSVGMQSHLGEWQFADFSRLPGRYPYIALVPQWDFLKLVTNAARKYAGFQLHLQAEVKGLLIEDQRVVGLKFVKDGTERGVRASLSVAADGRSSIVRQQGGLVPLDLGAPIDVLWFRLPRIDGDPNNVAARLGEGAMLVLIDRGDYWQIAYVIAKDGFEPMRAGDIAELQRQVVKLAPFLAGREQQIRNWDEVHLLRVQLDRLQAWHRPGLLCIGDAAHAMSPVGGVGINLAVQDAVAAANRLAGPLLEHRLDDRDLAAVQRRRELPTRLTQAAQRAVHRKLLEPMLAGAPPVPPLALRMMAASAWGRGLAARMVGLGVRPEHVRSPQIAE